MVDAALIVDANLGLLLVVGAADRRFVRSHKRLKAHYDEADYVTVSAFLNEFTLIVTVPHVLAEMSNLSRFMEGGGPAKLAIRESFGRFVDGIYEQMTESRLGTSRSEFLAGMGLTDSILLGLAETGFDGRECFLFTADVRLYNRALANGCEAFLFDVETGQIS